MKYKLLVENFRKFVSEAEEDDFLGDDDMDIDIPEPTAPRAPVTRAALDAAEAERQQKASALATKRAAIADKDQAEMDAAFPEDTTGLDMPGQQTVSAQQRVQQAYIAARRSLGREGTESTGIARAMTMLADDPKALERLKMLVTGDESTGYKFIDATKPKDTSMPQPPGTYRR